MCFDKGRSLEPRVSIRQLRTAKCRETSVLCCGLEKNGMVGAWHGHGMASVNQTRPRHGMAGERHGHGLLCVNRPLKCLNTLQPTDDTDSKNFTIQKLFSFCQNIVFMRSMCFLKSSHTNPTH